MKKKNVQPSSLYFCSHLHTQRGLTIGRLLSPDILTISLIYFPLRPSSLPQISIPSPCPSIFSFLSSSFLSFLLPLMWLIVWFCLILPASRIPIARAVCSEASSSLGILHPPHFFLKNLSSLPPYTPPLPPTQPQYLQWYSCPSVSDRNN